MVRNFVYEAVVFLIWRLGKKLLNRFYKTVVFLVLAAITAPGSEAVKTGGVDHLKVFVKNKSEVKTRATLYVQAAKRHSPYRSMRSEEFSIGPGEEVSFKSGRAHHKMQLSIYIGNKLKLKKSLGPYENSKDKKFEWDGSELSPVAEK